MKYIQFCFLLFYALLIVLIPSDILNRTNASHAVFQVSSYQGFSFRGGRKQEFFEQPGFRQFTKTDNQTVGYPQEKYIDLRNNLPHKIRLQSFFS